MNKVYVTVAMPLSDECKDNVEQYLTARYGAHITYWQEDESLLGGIVIFDGKKVFDGSLKSRLDGLKV